MLGNFFKVLGFHLLIRCHVYIHRVVYLRFIIGSIRPITFSFKYKKPRLGSLARHKLLIHVIAFFGQRTQNNTNNGI